VVLVSEFFDILERVDLSANYLVKIAGIISGTQIIVAFFYEQAAL